MRRSFLPAGLLLVALVALSRSAPVDGTSWAKHKMDGGQPDRPTVTRVEKTFLAGQRAAVIVINLDHEKGADLEVKVFDSKQRLVAQDRSTEPARDFLAAIWYPPRQETYRIEVINHSELPTLCSIAIK
jgi:hypothetical protein